MKTIHYHEHQQMFETHIDVLDEFMQRCEDLAWDCWLQTSFGPRDTYMIAFDGTGYNFYHKNSYKSGIGHQIGFFKTRTDLVMLLIRYPEMYAENVRTGDLFFWTNWIHFLKAFKLYQWNAETSMTRYSAREIKSAV